MKIYILFFLSFIMSICVNAQTDTTFTDIDSTTIGDYIIPGADIPDEDNQPFFGKNKKKPKTKNKKKPDSQDKKTLFKREKPKPEVPLMKRIMKPEGHSSLSATAYSLVLPGAGQIYNKKYWKLPIVYGGLGWMGYRIHRTTQTHRLFRDAYVARIDEDPLTVDEIFVFFSDANVNSRRLESKRQQELAIIGFGVVYILVAVDAFVDAHLWSFDINDDLSMQIGPALLPPAPQQPANIGLSFQLRAKAPPEIVPLSILTE